MFSWEYVKLRLRLWWGKGVELWIAALCGMFVSLGLLYFVRYGFSFGNWHDVVRGVAFAAFLLTAVRGIFSRPRQMPKAVFALAQMVCCFLFPGSAVAVVQILLWPLLLLPLVLCARWRGAGFAALALTLMVPFGTVREREIARSGLEIPTSLYLPASLTSERPGGTVLVLGGEGAEELCDRIEYREWLFHRLPHGGYLTTDGGRGFDIAIAGAENCFRREFWRKCLYMWLNRILDPDGVLVMPADETKLLPPGNWFFTVLPGGEARWVAARRGAAVCADPETLDRRAMEFSRAVGTVPVVPTGAIVAMYPPAVSRRLEAPPTVAPAGFSWRTHGYCLLLFAVLWGVWRLLLCRNAYWNTAAAAMEVGMAAAFYTCASFPFWCGRVMDFGVMPFALFAAVGGVLLPLRCPQPALRWRLLTAAVFGILPWLPGMSWSFLPLIGWFYWFRAEASVLTRLRLENRGASLSGVLAGAALGVFCCIMFGAGAAPLMMCAALLLFVPPLLRR